MVMINPIASSMYSNGKAINCIALRRANASSPYAYNRLRPIVYANRLEMMNAPSPVKRMPFWIIMFLSSSAQL